MGDSSALRGYFRKVRKKTPDSGLDINGVPEREVLVKRRSPGCGTRSARVESVELKPASEWGSSRAVQALWPPPETLWFCLVQPNCKWTELPNTPNVDGPCSITQRLHYVCVGSFLLIRCRLDARSRSVPAPLYCRAQQPNVPAPPPLGRARFTRQARGPQGYERHSGLGSARACRSWSWRRLGDQEAPGRCGCHSPPRAGASRKSGGACGKSRA